jgi:hypothetical protein
MADGYTILNPGSGGDAMDEAIVFYPPNTEGPSSRKRPRVVISGENQEEIVPLSQNTPSGKEYGLLTRSIVEYPGLKIAEFSNVSLVPPNTATTIVSYIVPTGFTFNFIGFIASGNANALFKIYVNSNPKIAGRNSVANLTLNMNYSFPIFEAYENDIIILNVFHQVNADCDFEGTILGYNI